MNSVKKTNGRRKPTHLHELPLFDWANCREQNPMSPGGRWISRRTGVPSRVAEAHAEANGFGKRGKF